MKKQNNSGHNNEPSLILTLMAASAAIGFAPSASAQTAVPPGTLGPPGMLSPASPSAPKASATMLAPAAPRASSSTPVAPRPATPVTVAPRAGASAPVAPSAPAAAAAAASPAPATRPATRPAATVRRAPAPAPVAPAQAAFRAADAGYKAYESRDFTAAVGHAEEAVRLAPARRDYWVLLANALIGAGRHADAEQALQRGEAINGPDAVFTQARESMRRAQAQAAGAEMYKALAANDLPRAIAQGRAATAFAPDHAGYRLALVHAMLRAGQFADAERVAGEAIAMLPDSAVPLALRAYARQRLDRFPDARADIDRALQQRGLAAADQRELRLIAADAALAMGEPQRALDLMANLPAKDAAVATRTAVARQSLAAGNARAAIALTPPAIDCSNVERTQTCSIAAGAPPTAPGYEAAAAGYKALEARDHAAALESATLAVAASPGNRDYLLLQMQAAMGAQRYDVAESAATAALALAPQDATLLTQRAEIRRRMGNVALANEDARAALQAGNLPPLERAYLANQLGETRLAYEQFAAANAANALPVTSLQDAGYAAIRARKDAEAVEYFKRALDAAESMQLKMDRQMAFDTRRTISEVERKWGVLASLTWRSGGGAEPGFGITNAGSQRTLQAGAEVYWRPWGFMNGRFVELFARGFQTLSSEGGGAQGGDSFAGALGGRWKPFTQHNVVLSFSRLFGKGVDADWLAQAAYSLDNGTDLRVDVPSWWTTRIAAEVGRYFSPTQTYGLGSAMFGRSYRMGGEQGQNVLFPHVFAAAEYNSALAEKSAVAVGPGVSWRHWFNGDKYHAPRSYFDLTLQYRMHVGGDDRIKGGYINGLISY
ncbi:NfrA family protein [Ramlibacter sp.]|uniref:NfrA family protein n=1 Tax=Ramlibacter sp. TaxID=1917967 RepID=UPI003D0F29ED